MKTVLAATLLALSIGAAYAQNPSMNIIRAQVPVVFVADANPDPSEGEPAAITLTLNNGLLPDGTVSTGYNFDLNPLISWSNLPEGSQPPAITWSVTNALPAGLVLNPNGTITGNPTEAGTTAFEVVAMSSSSSGQNLFTLKIKAQLVVTLQDATLPEARVGQTYSYDFAPLAQWTGLESGEQPPALEWSTNDALPQGLTLSESGTLSGTPVQAGDATFEILAASVNQDGSKSYTLKVGSVVLIASSITIGKDHACALVSGGVAKCWGANNFGQLGNGTTVASSTPVPVSGLGSNVKSISAGLEHTCAIDSSSMLKCWGNGGSGRLGNSSVSTQTTPVNSLANVKMVSPGNDSTCAVTLTDDAYCWGNGGYGKLGLGNETSYNNPRLVTALGKVKTISQGVYAQGCAVKQNGAAVCWGHNGAGRLGNGSTTNSLVPVNVTGLDSGVAQIVTAYDMSCAIMETGAAKCWGSNYSGKLGVGSTSPTHSTVPMDVYGLTSGVSTISLGPLANASHVCAVHNGAAKCWGDNTDGRLGDGSGSIKTSPTVVSGLSSGVQGIEVGNTTSCAMMSTGAVKCWGSNAAGILGSGSSSPTPVDLNVN